MPRRKRNPNQFTTDEAQTATLIYAEGAFVCSREIRDKYRYAYPMIEIRMCAKEGLEPASRVFGTKIRAIRTKTIECPPELFPPDGKGRWGVAAKGGTAQKPYRDLLPSSQNTTNKNGENYSKDADPNYPTLFSTRGE